MSYFERDYEFVALRDDDGRYPIDRGRIISSSGLDIPAEGFDDHFVEEHEGGFNALHSRLRDGGSYMTGPWRAIASRSTRCHRWPVTLPARPDSGGHAALVPEHHRARSGVLDAIEEALRLIEATSRPTPRRSLSNRATRSAAESARHRAESSAPLSDRCRRRDPRRPDRTADVQNQRAIEEDLRGFVAEHLDLADDDRQWQCEQAIRNYDPCISCATHFLKLDVERT